MVRVTSLLLLLTPLRPNPNARVSRLLVLVKVAVLLSLLPSLSSSFSLVRSFQPALSSYILFRVICADFPPFHSPSKGSFTHTHRAQTTHNNDDDDERKPRARAGTDGDNNSSNAIRNTNDSNAAALLKLYELNGKRRDESRGDPGPRGLHFRHRFLLREAEKPEEDAEQVGVSEVRSESEETLLVRGE